MEWNVGDDDHHGDECDGGGCESGGSRLQSFTHCENALD